MFFAYSVASEGS